MRTMYLPLRRNRLAFCLVCSRSNIVKIQFKSSLSILHKSLPRVTVILNVGVYAFK